MLTRHTRRAVSRALGCAASAVLFLCACTRTESRSLGPTGSGGVRTASLPDRYVALSVDVACLARRETDPGALADGTWALYRKHGFTPVHTWLEQLDTLGKDPAIQRQIVDGMRRCRN